MKTKLVLFIIVAITGWHCNKELAEQPVIEPAKVQLLTREVSFTTSNPNLKQVREFTYDDNNRCTQILIGTIDSSAASPTLTISRTFTLYYNATNEQPYKIASVRTVFPNLVTDFYFKHSSTGVKMQDSVRVLNQANQPADKVINYEYYDNLIITTPVLTGFPIDNNPFDSLFVNNKNIAKKVSRMPTPTGDQIHSFTFQYDDKINPYAVMNIANAMYFTNSALGIAYNVPTETHYMGFNRNNMVSFVTDGSFKTVAAYEYDQFKYPVKKESYPETAPTMKTITYFSYKDKK